MDKDEKKVKSPKLLFSYETSFHCLVFLHVFLKTMMCGGKMELGIRQTRIHILHNYMKILKLSKLAIWL